MSDWGTKHLGELLDRPLAYGVLKPGPYEAGGIPLVRIQDHKDGEIKSNSFHKIPLALHQEFRRTELRTGDIIISVVGTIGRTAIIPKYLTGANVSRAFAVIGCSDEVDVHFLDQYLKSDISQSWFREQCQGNAQQVLNLGTLREYPVPIPPLPEQKKIAEILSGIDNAIIIYEQQAKALASLLDALMREEIVMNAFARFVKIGAACTAQAGGTPDRSVKRYYEGNIPWVKSGEVKGGNIIHTDESISDEAVSSSTAKIVPAGSVLIAMYGATAGQTARLRINAATNQAVLSLNSSTSELSNDYLYHAVTAFKGQLLLACQGSGQPNLSSGLIKELEIPLPDLFTQNRISSALDSVNHRTSLLRSKICSTMALKSSVSADLLSGRKRVTV